MAQLGSSSWASPQNDGILGRYRYEMLFFWSPSRRNPIKSPHIRMASDGLFENAVPQNQVVVFSIKTAMLHNFESTPDFTVTERNEDITRRTILGRHLSELLRAMFLPRIRRTLHHRQCESTVWMQLPITFWRCTSHQQPLTTDHINLWLLLFPLTTFSIPWADRSALFCVRFFHIGVRWRIASGKLTVCYWKLPFIVYSGFTL